MVFRMYSWRILAFFCLSLSVSTALAQNAQVNGVVSDPQKAVIPHATIEIVNQATQVKEIVTSNGAGVYSIPSLPPGRYRITVSAPGFETQAIDDITIAVAGKLSLDTVLHPGSVNQTVSVDGSGLEVNTTDATVSTVIDRQFVENMPLNGRSFQSLLTLVPGVAVVPSSGGVGYSGEITVNGQRTEANYFTVDGVSANTGAAAVSSIIGWGSGYSGSVPQETVLGTTQGIVPIEALQEFRATTSTYSAQYGRTPGGQFEFVTRSGTNQLHGDVFDYLRNDVFDANSAINNFDGIAKQRERQNDFGGTLGGPLSIPRLYSGRDRTFFFAAYEGLRLTSPQSSVTDVPTYEVRNAAAVSAPAMTAFLNAFPLPTAGLPGANGLNGETDEGNGMAIFQSGYSVPSALDNGTLRIDQQVGEKLRLFARYSYTRSDTTARNTFALSEIEQQGNLARSITTGATAFLTQHLLNELRFNYTASTAGSQDYLDDFGGAVPFDASTIPVLSLPNSNLYFELDYGKVPYFTLTPRTTTQHQINVVDWMGYTVGRHTLRWGVDYRHLANSEGYPSVYEYPVFTTAAQTEAGTPYYNFIFKLGLDKLEPTFGNTSLFVQDEWKATARLNVSLGLRWDLNPPPGASNGALPYALTSTNLSTVALAPEGTPMWHTVYTNFAPRIGLAYQAHTTPGYETTVRAGFGMFYDMPYATALQDYWGTGYMAYSTLVGQPFPATQQDYENSPSPTAASPYNSITYGFDPHLKTPYTLEWNAAVEQGLGSRQSLLLNYVASGGRDLLINRPYNPAVDGNANFSAGDGFYLTNNAATSSYNALQVRFDRKMAQGLQALLSYTWSHTIDDDSSNFASDQLFRANSDYDIRNNFQAAVTYDLPGRYSNALLNTALAHWSLDSRVTARSALPVNVIGTTAYSSNGTGTYYYPNRVPNQPLYLYGSSYAGGRVINYNAFSLAKDSSGNNIEGNFGRNGARGFDAVQADIAVRKDFILHEGIGLQFRAEAFNLLNHPIWGTIYNQLNTGQVNFGHVYTMENTQLGGLNALYQTGGPRSLQFALKLHF